MTSPVVSHPVCDLAMRQRVHDARVDAVARSAARAKGRRSLLDRLRGRTQSRDVDPDVRQSGEDVWRALRF